MGKGTPALSGLDTMRRHNYYNRKIAGSTAIHSSITTPFSENVIRLYAENSCNDATKMAWELLPVTTLANHNTYNAAQTILLSM